jgi:hypothetical protein
MVHLGKRNKEKHLKVAGLAASVVISTILSAMYATARVVAMRDLHLIQPPISHLVAWYHPLHLSFGRRKYH